MSNLYSQPYTPEAIAQLTKSFAQLKAEEAAKANEPEDLTEDTDNETDGEDADEKE